MSFLYAEVVAGPDDIARVTFQAQANVMLMDGSHN